MDSRGVRQVRIRSQYEPRGGGRAGRTKVGIASIAAMLTPSALALILSGTCPQALVWQPAAPADAQTLLAGVKSITQSGTAGLISAWGPDAFAVVLGGSGRHQAPIVAAGTLGKGRVMGWTHGFCSTAAAEKLDTGRLLTNAARWLSWGPKDGPIRVALLDADLTAWFKTQGIETVVVKGGDGLAGELGGCTALFCGKADLSAKEVDAVLAFVHAGGGFSCFSCPWGWSQVRKKPVSEAPLNRILAPAGLALADGYAELTTKGGFAVEGVPGPEFNAGRAVDVLEKGEKGADKKLMGQAAATAVLAARTMPREDALLRPRLSRLLAARADGLMPSDTNPLKESRALDRVLLTVQLEDLAHLAPEQVKAHPAAKNFPGEVAPDAKRGTVTVDVKAAADGGAAGWLSTGAYAAPGEVVTVTCPGGEKAGLRVRIGCHQDDLWALPEWKRAPAIDRSWALDGASVRIANAFGGPVYVEVPDGLKAGAKVTLAGVVEAPLFVLGATNDEAWRAIRERPAPWAELVCDRVALSVPTSVARKIDNPTAIMEHWVRVMDAVADLAGRPRERKRPERYVADVQISAGYMHSGYPIMTHLDAASFMTDLKGLTDQGWGPYHEMGHNHQDGMWTFDGTTEVTCNLFTVYVLETVCGVEHAETTRVLNDEGTRKRVKHLAEGARFEKWKSDPFLALQMYAMVKREFGWAPFKAVFAEYRDLPRAQRPKGDDEKRDQWMQRLSRAVGRNLGPFFEAWGVPTSEGAREAVAGLPVWLPTDMKPDNR